MGPKDFTDPRFTGENEEETSAKLVEFQALINAGRSCFRMRLEIILMAGRRQPNPSLRKKPRRKKRWKLIFSLAGRCETSSKFIRGIEKHGCNEYDKIAPKITISTEEVKPIPSSSGNGIRNLEVIAPLSQDDGRPEC